MKGLKAFDIEIFRLIEGKQTFKFSLDETFFSSIEASIIDSGQLSATVHLDKSERHIQSVFEIKGVVELICDRSLEKFDFVLDTTHNLVFKFGDAFAEVSEDVIILPRDLPKLNLGHYLYEFIGLSIPIKKLHPKFGSSEDDEEVTLVYSSEENKDDVPTSKEEKTDPRWDLLKNLKNKLK